MTRMRRSVLQRIVSGGRFLKWTGAAGSRRLAD
jgi:hypothetical protein